MLWPDFKAVWPSAAPGYTGSPAGIVDPFATMGPWPIPTLNTAILLSSGVTVTIAHHALIANHRARAIVFMWLTVLLGLTFLGFQAYEYMHAYSELNLKLSSGAYGSTFFMLTGFHGFHVFVGMLMLLFITIRIMQRPLHARAPLRLRGRGLVLALRRRRLARPLHRRLLALNERRYAARSARIRSAAERDAGRVDPAERQAMTMQAKSSTETRDADGERAHHVAAFRAFLAAAAQHATPAQARAARMTAKATPMRMFIVEDYGRGSSS